MQALQINEVPFRREDRKLLGNSMKLFRKMRRSARFPGRQHEVAVRCRQRAKIRHSMPSQPSTSIGNLLGKSRSRAASTLMESLGEVQPIAERSCITRCMPKDNSILQKITNLPVGVRAQTLRQEARIAPPQIVRRHRSSDGAVLVRSKAPLPNESAKTIESSQAAVRRPQRSKLSLCRLKIARRSVYPPRRAAPWIAVSALPRLWG